MTKIKIVPLVFLLIASPTWGAVTIDNINSGVEGTDPINISRTIDAAATLDVVLCIADSGTTSVDSVTRGADTYTMLAEHLDPDGSNANIWYKVNPTSGTSNAVANVSDSGNEGVKCWAISVFGSDTSTPFTDSVCATGDTTTSSNNNSVTTASGELVVDIVGTGTSQTGFTQGGNQTKTMDYPAGANNHSGAGSYQAGADGGALTWSWTGGSSAVAHCIASIKAAATSNRRVAPIFFQ